MPFCHGNLENVITFDYFETNSTGKKWIVNNNYVNVKQIHRF